MGKNHASQYANFGSLLMMQLAMLFGFFCAYPMNALLIKLGIKKGM